MGPDHVQTAVDLARQAIWITILLSMPLLLVGLAVGLVISVLQAATQIQEQTLSFLPKILAVVAVLFGLLPWLLIQMMEYTTTGMSAVVRSLRSACRTSHPSSCPWSMTSSRITSGDDARARASPC